VEYGAAVGRVVVKTKLDTPGTTGGADAISGQERSPAGRSRSSRQSSTDGKARTWERPRSPTRERPRYSDALASCPRAETRARVGEADKMRVNFKKQDTMREGHESMQITTVVNTRRRSTGELLN